MRTTVAILATVLAFALSGCGGGGGGSESAAAGCTPTMADPNACLPKLAFSLTDSSGAQTHSLSIDNPATVSAQIIDGDGNPIPDIVVTFQTDGGETFVPSSGTALTDASGIAQVGMQAGPEAGAFTVSVAAVAEGTALSSSITYEVSYPALAMSVPVALPDALSAGGTASVSVTVSLDGQPYTTQMPVSFASICAAAGKAMIEAQVTTRDGVATATYVDKGCASVDRITATLPLGEQTITQTGSLTVLPAVAGSMAFVAADRTDGHMALRGTGGIDRQEFSNITFRVFDRAGQPVAGTVVDFAFGYPAHDAAAFGLSLYPRSSISDLDGYVTTTVSAGNIPTPVRVMPSIRGSDPLITTLSNLLVVSSGVPDQAHFSLSTETGNCEGRHFDQLCTKVWVVLADHFGNAVADDTVVSFTTEGGMIEPSCRTVGGRCFVLLYSSEPRPADGRVTVLAYALGEENFIDANGDNLFNGSETFTDMGLDIFRDDDESGAWGSNNEPCVGPNSDQHCTTPGDGEYNGVLRSPQNLNGQVLYISDQLVQTFSSSYTTISASPGSLTCVAGVAEAQVNVTDGRGNLMPAGTSITFSAQFGGQSATVTPSSATVPNVVYAVGQPPLIPAYAVSVTCPQGGGSGTLNVQVSTPNGVVTEESFAIN